MLPAPSIWRRKLLPRILAACHQGMEDIFKRLQNRVGPIQLGEPRRRLQSQVPSGKSPTADAATSPGERRRGEGTPSRTNCSCRVLSATIRIGTFGNLGHMVNSMPGMIVDESRRRWPASLGPCRHGCPPPAPHANAGFVDHHRAFGVQGSPRGSKLWCRHPTPHRPPRLSHATQRIPLVVRRTGMPPTIRVVRPLSLPDHGAGRARPPRLAGSRAAPDRLLPSGSFLHDRRRATGSNGIGRKAEFGLEPGARR